MTVNVYRYYGSPVTQGEVISSAERYKRFHILHLLKKAFIDDLAFDWRLLELLFAFVLSAVNIILLFKGNIHILVSFLLFFSLCLYVSLFLLNLKVFIKKNYNVDIL
ncbi:MAG: hypothetical protein EHM79_20500 [Geobacter sp.]|nr:MAG: hypothetical protein EHM79_20500 [Geobacter sp.]